MRAPTGVCAPGRSAARGVTATLLALLLVLAALPGIVAVPPPVLAAQHGGPDLTLVTDARYDVVAEERRVHVTVRITATNHLRDTATRRFYFDRAFLAVLPGTSGFRITGDAGTPKVVVNAEREDHTLLRIDFGARLASGKSTGFVLQFDLVDPGGAGNRDVRIGTTVVSFPIWAFGTDATPGSRVSVALPAEYNVEFLAGELPEPDVVGDLAVYASGPLAEPLTFFAYLVGDRPGTYVDTDLVVPLPDGSATFLVQSWADDAEWGDRVSDLFRRGLPVLGREIGLSWPEADATVVREALARSTGGYAGLFDPSEGRIDVAYYAGPDVVLHEAAHGWFNGRLLADRWANEAFASYYGIGAATELGVDGNAPELTEELAAARIPLNAWGPVGSEEEDAESYGYAASLTVARIIAERAGDDRLREVWAKASGRIGAYQPIGGDANAPATNAEEGVDGPPDWRGLLDLLEDTTGTSFVDVWRNWVVRPTDRLLLDERDPTRTRYFVVVDAADEWRLPRAVRDAMRAWRFETANGLLDDALEALDLRLAIAREADRLGLTPPGTLRDLFESGDGFDAAIAEGTAQLEVLEVLAAAGDARLPTPTIIETLGLIGTEPDLDMAAARDAYEAGDLEEAVTRAAAAHLAWATAEDVGRGRALSLVLLALAAAILLVLVVRRGTSRRRPTTVSLPGATSDPGGEQGGGGQDGRA